MQESSDVIPYLRGFQRRFPVMRLDTIQPLASAHRDALFGHSTTTAIAAAAAAVTTTVTVSQYRYKTNYDSGRVLRFKENVEKEDEEEEIRAKYVFRPRLPALIQNDHFDARFQNEYDRICQDDYGWDLEYNCVKTVWERLKPPPLEKVDQNFLAIGNSRSVPWAPNEWCIERAFDCHRNRRDVLRIHLTVEFLKMLPGLRKIGDQLQQKDLMERTRKLFELVCQTYYTGDLKRLIESDENAEPIVKHITEIDRLEPTRRNLLNVTEQDIITVAPGHYGAIQDLFRVYFASTYSLSMTCCALYRKNLLYSVADEKYKLSKKQIAIPYEYTYNVPHLIFANFGYWYSRRSCRFELYDLHILAFSVLPWYKKQPATDGKFFSPPYERIGISYPALLYSRLKS